jgi:hypothetical protein
VAFTVRHLVGEGFRGNLSDVEEHEMELYEGVRVNETYAVCKQCAVAGGVQRQ